MMTAWERRLMEAPAIRHPVLLFVSTRGYLGRYLGDGGVRKFAYVGYAYGSYGGTSATNFVFQDCEFVQCAGDAIYIMDTSYNVQLLNDLFTGCGAILAGDNSITVAAQNITADINVAFVDTSGTPSWGGTITNSILMRVR